jgi:hypothetical protein
VSPLGAGLGLVPSGGAALFRVDKPARRPDGP